MGRSFILEGEGYSFNREGEGRSHGVLIGPGGGTHSRVGFGFRLTLMALSLLCIQPLSRDKFMVCSANLFCEWLGWDRVCR